ncbi:DUF6301 family protein [Nocardia neocaledoniensis]|uniref:DUF6301 family protein n=1 Tax=Nocardia neocaledoniensis TaxID=236511 RepID=UPI002455311C|nr:DUF6301 family protein [Nocardia neocaledoniensis]
MSTWRALPVEQATELASELRALDWSWTAAKVGTAFTDFAQAITATLGEPTAQVKAPTSQYRWGGSDATVVLIRSAASVWLHLVTNSRLAADDRNLQLDQQGLL